MTELILGLVGALTGSGAMAVLLAILNRRWQQKDKLEEIKQKLLEHCRQDDERHMKQCRTRILRFNDEVIRGMHHTKEHFGDVLDDITEYTTYCDNHREFKNEKAVLAIENVRRTYAICEQKNSFLTGRETA